MTGLAAEGLLWFVEMLKGRTLSSIYYRLFVRLSSVF